MTDQPKVKTREDSPKSVEDRLVQAFVRLSGYKPGDVHNLNTKSKVVVTKNGGKYQIGSDPLSIRRIHGPMYPKAMKVEAPEAPEEE
jgi:hypothetical protein